METYTLHLLCSHAFSSHFPQALWLLDNAVIAESAEFQMGKSKYNYKAEHLQHIVNQQRTRLEQTSVELNGIEKEVSLASDSN